MILKYSFTIGAERRINDKEAINEKATSDNPAIRVGLLNSDCQVLSLKGEMNNKYDNEIQTNISKIKNYCKAEEYHQKYIEKTK